MSNIEGGLLGGIIGDRQRLIGALNKNACFPAFKD
jgi:hypothetical protein